MDNNIAERAQRGVAVGRKVFYGAGSLVSGHMAAHLYSLFGTWSNAGLNLRTTLTDYLNFCVDNGLHPPDPADSDKVDAFGERLRTIDPSPWLPWKMDPERKQLLARPLPGASPFADTG